MTEATPTTPLSPAAERMRRSRGLRREGLSCFSRSIRFATSVMRNLPNPGRQSGPCIPAHHQVIFHSASQSIPAFLGHQLETRVHFCLIQSPFKRVVSKIIEPVADVGNPVEGVWIGNSLRANKIMEDQSMHPALTRPPFPGVSVGPYVCRIGLGIRPSDCSKGFRLFSGFARDAVGQPSRDHDT